MTRVRVTARSGQGGVRVRVDVSVGRKARAERLKFFAGNAKLDSAILTFSLPAGHFCPFARDCLSKADRLTGRLKDGPDTVFRCFAASGELRQSVRGARWHNARLLKGKTREEIVSLILASLSPYAGYVRVHVSGDFYSQDYFDA